jgi:hypothetical protein
MAKKKLSKPTSKSASPKKVAKKSVSAPSQAKKSVGKSSHHATRQLSEEKRNSLILFFVIVGTIILFTIIYARNSAISSEAHARNGRANPLTGFPTLDPTQIAIRRLSGLPERMDGSGEKWNRLTPRPTEGKELNEVRGGR